MADFFDELESLDEIDFFKSLAKYDPCPREVGDRFVIMARGYNKDRQVFRIIRADPDKLIGGMSIVYTLDDAVPDPRGFYTYVGCIHLTTLEKYAKEGTVFKKK
jgi:hypothetical protein